MFGGKHRKGGKCGSKGDFWLGNLASTVAHLFDFSLPRGGGFVYSFFVHFFSPAQYFIQ